MLDYVSADLGTRGVVAPAASPRRRLNLFALMRTGNLLDRVFWFTVAFKGVFGVFETLGGITLMIVTPHQIDSVITGWLKPLLDYDPDNGFANLVVNYTHQLNGSQTLFGAIYFTVHGLIKVFLAWAVLEDWGWAYPLMLAFLVVFIGYQGYEIAVHQGIGMILLTAFDIFLVWLTVLEWRKHRTRFSRAHQSLSR